jgi:hypothetical protein
MVVLGVVPREEVVTVRRTTCRLGRASRVDRGGVFGSGSDAIGLRAVDAAAPGGLFFGA